MITIKKYQRLQGKNWHLVKNSFILLYTYKSDNGNIKGIYTDGKIKISHWLNNEEKTDYETTMAEKNELKKQLEDANEKIILLQASELMLNYKKALEETQQKEFIKYLEDNWKQTQDIWYIKILQKYKKIIGE